MRMSVFRQNKREQIDLCGSSVLLEHPLVLRTRQTAGVRFF